MARHWVALIATASIVLLPDAAATRSRAGERVSGSYSAPRQQASVDSGFTEEDWVSAGDCLKEAVARGAPGRMLEQIEKTLSSGPPQYAAVELASLTTLQPGQVWQLAGGMPQPPIAAPRLAAMLFRLAGSGLFSAVSVAPRVENDEARALVSLEEVPAIRSIVVRGVVEVSSEDAIKSLLSLPRFPGDERPVGRWHRGHWEPADSEPATESQCAIEDPSPSLLARLERGSLKPGLMRGGVAPALQSLRWWLYEQGYLMATLSAELSANGVLAVDVDEGRIEAVEIHGVQEPSISKVAKALGVRPGQIFLRSELQYGLERVRQTFPFLPSPVALPGAPGTPDIVEDRTADGTRRYRLGASKPAYSPAPPTSAPARLWSRRIARRVRHASADNNYSRIEGRRLQIFFSPRYFGLHGDLTLLLRHTPFSNWGPGVSFTGWIYDPGDRIHLALDVEIAAGKGPFHWIVGPRLQIPAISIAELGVHFYGLDDTPDRWRMSALDSYLHSLFLNRPQSEYYRRSGFSPFLTFHLAEHLVLGLEYRLDDYESLPSLSHIFTFFNRSEAPWPNPDIEAGKMSSLIFRFEWSTQAARPWRVGNWQRHPETSLVDREWKRSSRTHFRTLNTVEVARRDLGSDSFHFTKVISDNVFYFKPGFGQGIRLRFRVGAGNNLPVQKQEALGGWSALQGYDFKEYRGDASLLGSAEYQFYVLGMFADVGSVHQETGWISPRLGLGLALHLGSDVRFSLAWRTDSRATGAPEVDFFFTRAF